MNLPDKCPFCGAGSEIRNAEKWVGFTCITTIHAGHDARRMQSATCAGLERTLLLARVAELEARCKRLEEALKECDRGFTKHCPDEWSTNGASWKAVREALGEPNPWEKSTP